MSQKLNKQQRNWNATEKECFAVVSSIRKWNHYVAGRDFIVRTDHHALCWLNRRYNSNPKLNRWRMALQDYTFSIEHVKGNKNCVADCLSRYPVKGGGSRPPKCPFLCAHWIEHSFLHIL